MTTSFGLVSSTLTSANAVWVPWYLQRSSDHDCPCVTVVGRSLSHADRTSCLGAPVLRAVSSGAWRHDRLTSTTLPSGGTIKPPEAGSKQCPWVTALLKEQSASSASINSWPKLTPTGQHAWRDTNRSSGACSNACGRTGSNRSATRSPSLLIRRSGQVVQDRPSPVVGWADIPELSTCVGYCSAAWLQAWLQSRRNGADPRPSALQAGHIPSCDGWWECCELSPVALARRWLPDGYVSFPAARNASAANTIPPRLWPLSAAPLPHRTDCCRPIRRRGGVKGRFACTFTRHFDLCSLPCGQDRPLMPYRRRITIWRQSGGGPLQLPWSFGIRW